MGHPPFPRPPPARSPLRGVRTADQRRSRCPLRRHRPYRQAPRLRWISSCSSSALPRHRSVSAGRGASPLSGPGPAAPRERGSPPGCRRAPRPGGSPGAPVLSPEMMPAPRAPLSGRPYRQEGSSRRRGGLPGRCFPCSVAATRHCGRSRATICGSSPPARRRSRPRPSWLSSPRAARCQPAPVDPSVPRGWRGALPQRSPPPPVRPPPRASRELPHGVSPSPRREPPEGRGRPPTVAVVKPRWPVLPSPSPRCPTANLGLREIARESDSAGHEPPGGERRQCAQLIRRRAARPANVLPLRRRELPGMSRESHPDRHEPTGDTRRKSGQSFRRREAPPTNSLPVLSPELRTPAASLSRRAVSHLPEPLPRFPPRCASPAPERHPDCPPADHPRRDPPDPVSAPGRAGSFGTPAEMVRVHRAAPQRPNGHAGRRRSAAGSPAAPAVPQRDEHPSSASGSS